MRALLAAAALWLACLGAAQEADAPPAPPDPRFLLQEIASDARRLKLQRLAERVELRDLDRREKEDLAALASEPATGAEQVQRRLAVQQRYAHLREDARRRYADERRQLESELKADRLKERALQTRKKAETPA